MFTEIRFGQNLETLSGMPRTDLSDKAICKIGLRQLVFLGGAALDDSFSELVNFPFLLGLQARSLEDFTCNDSKVL